MGELRIGDVFVELDGMHAAGETVDLVITSPPFLLQRAYLPADHSDHHLEHGQESTPAGWLANQLDVIAACGRVLSPTGSIAWEVGDKRSGSGSGPEKRADGHGHLSPVREKGGTVTRSGNRRSRAVDVAAGILTHTNRPGPAGRDLLPGWPLDKSICCTPWALAMSLAYGRNVLAQPVSASQMLAWVDEQVAGGLDVREALTTARRMLACSEDAAIREFEPWRIRNVVAWTRPNPPVGALGDKWRDATSYITIATRSARRWWDGEATRVPLSAKTLTVSNGLLPSAKNVGSPTASHRMTRQVDPDGTAPLLDWWQITNPGTKVVDPETGGTHYACWPPEIARRLILVMCPERVCTSCGEPSRRIVNKTAWPERMRDPLVNDEGDCSTAGRHGERAASPPTLDWTDCGHDTWRRGRVLDLYAGTGTTLAVAELLGRDAIGIDLNPVNARLLDQRRVEVARQMKMAIPTVDPEAASLVRQLVAVGMTISGIAKEMGVPVGDIERLVAAA